jgi:hypothetical protein
MDQPDVTDAGAAETAGKRKPGAAQHMAVAGVDAKRARKGDKQRRQQSKAKSSSAAAARGAGFKPQGVANLRAEALQVSYYMDANGFQQVPPYVYEFQTFAKDR